MDINYAAPKGRRNIETIFVTILYNPSLTPGHLVAELIAYERRSTYSIYRACGDGPSSEALCICDSNTYFYNKVHNWLEDALSDSLLSQPESLKINNCIYVVRNHVIIGGSTLYSVNICEKETHQLRAAVKNINGVSFTTISLNGWRIKPLSIHFLFIATTVTPQSFIKLFQFSATSI